MYIWFYREAARNGEVMMCLGQVVMRVAGVWLCENCQGPRSYVLVTLGSAFIVKVWLIDRHGNSEGGLVVDNDWGWWRDRGSMRANETTQGLFGTV